MPFDGGAVSVDPTAAANAGPPGGKCSAPLAPPVAGSPVDSGALIPVYGRA